MLKRLTAKERLEQLADAWEPAVRRAWLAAIESIKNAAVLSRIAERLERRDIDGAVRMLNIDEDAFSEFETSLLDTYNDGGQATVETIPSTKDPEGNSVVYRWGVRNLAGEAALRAHAAQMVTDATEDMKAGIRDVLVESLSQGRNPHAAALDIVGRKDRKSGKREGGLIGLNAQQMKTAAWIHRAMLDGDEEKMRAYLRLKGRDARFDPTVRKALREHKPVSAENANRIYVQYTNRALSYRGKTIARHETMVALDTSRDEAFRQQINAGKLAAQDVTKTWRHTPREHPRIQHIEMAGQEVGFEEPFIAPDGTKLRYPRDPKAPARHTIGCFCRAEYSVDFGAAAVRKFEARRV